MSDLHCDRVQSWTVTWTLEIEPPKGNFCFDHADKCRLESNPFNMEFICLLHSIYHRLAASFTPLNPMANLS